MALLCERLKLIRRQRNLTQPDVAKDCGISLRAYKYYEAGEQEPSAGVLVKLCNYYDISADWLLGLSDEPGLP